MRRAPSASTRAAPVSARRSTARRLCWQPPQRCVDQIARSATCRGSRSPGRATAASRNKLRPANSASCPVASNDNTRTPGNRAIVAHASLTRHHDGLCRPACGAWTAARRHAFAFEHFAANCEPRPRAAAWHLDEPATPAVHRSKCAQRTFDLLTALTLRSWTRRRAQRRSRMRRIRALTSRAAATVHNGAKVTTSIHKWANDQLATTLGRAGAAETIDGVCAIRTRQELPSASAIASTRPFICRVATIRTGTTCGCHKHLASLQRALHAVLTGTSCSPQPAAVSRPTCEARGPVEAFTSLQERRAVQTAPGSQTKSKSLLGLDFTAFGLRFQSSVWTMP